MLCENQHPQQTGLVNQMQILTLLQYKFHMPVDIDVDAAWQQAYDRLSAILARP